MSSPVADAEGGGASVVRQGIATAAPIAVGVIPFGLVAGAAPIEAGQSATEAIGFSVFVFAGASQLAAIDILDGGGAVVVAVVSVLLINLRMVMYSASLAPHFSDVRLPGRLFSAYVLTDQAYALGLARFTSTDPIEDPGQRLRYYLGVALTFWCTWQTSTIVGALGGGSIPDSIPLDFAIPLAFMVILIPAVTDRPTVVAALVGGVGTVVASEVGVGDLSLVLGALLGILCGVLVGGHEQADAAAPEGERHGDDR